jgi:hypothetical protein
MQSLELASLLANRTQGTDWLAYIATSISMDNGGICSWTESIVPMYAPIAVREIKRKATQEPRLSFEQKFMLKDSCYRAVMAS